MRLNADSPTSAAAPDAAPEPETAKDASVVEIDEFTPGEDELVVFYDPTENPSPEVQAVADGEADVIVTLDDKAVMRVLGGKGLVSPNLVRLVEMTPA